MTEPTPEYILFQWYSPVGSSWGIWQNTGEWLAVFEDKDGKIVVEQISNVLYKGINQTFWTPMESVCMLKWLFCAECNRIAFDDYLCLECRSHA